MAMLLYKYMSLDKLWRVLDVLLLRRVYCAKWHKLNDPMEGYYEMYFDSVETGAGASLARYLEENRNYYRVASFSEDPTNFLLWSHYADGHKGVALEIYIDETEPALARILYSDFNPIFTDQTDTELRHPHIFYGKYEQWQYEKEWRIVTPETHFYLDTPCTRVLLGPRVELDRARILRAALPVSVSIIETRIETTIGNDLPCVIPKTIANGADELLITDGAKTD